MSQYDEREKRWQKLIEVMRPDLTEFSLCVETGHRAEQGECPVHHGDACLHQFVSLMEMHDLFVFR